MEVAWIGGGHWLGRAGGSLLKGAEVLVFVCVHYTLGYIFVASFHIPRPPSLGHTEPGLRYAPGAGDTNSNGEVTHSQLSPNLPRPEAGMREQLPRYRGYISWDPKA